MKTYKILKAIFIHGAYQFRKNDIYFGLLVICLVLASCKPKNNTPNFNQRPATMQEIPNTPPPPPPPPSNTPSQMASSTPEGAIPVYVYDGKPITEKPTGVRQQNEKSNQTPNKQSSSPSVQGGTSLAPVPFAAGEFTAQLISSKNRNSVEAIKAKLDVARYETEILEAYVNGERMYRLRLSGSYSREYAEYLAKEIQGKYSEITSFWVTKKE